MREILLIITIFITACSYDKKINYESIDSFPIKTGNTWEYSSVSILKIYESDISNIVIETDTFRNNLIVRIEKDTILDDTVNVFQFTSVRIGGKYKSSEYCFWDSTGFHTYAYSNGGSHVFPKKTHTKSGIESFGVFGPELFIDEDITVFPKTRHNLKFPLEMNSKWTYTFPYSPFYLQIDKEIVGYENIKIENRVFSCYKIKWIYLENKFFDGMTIFDWVSSEGLIKRVVIGGRARLTTPDGESIGSSQLTETIELTSHNLLQ